MNGRYGSEFQKEESGVCNHKAEGGAGQGPGSLGKEQLVSTWKRKGLTRGQRGLTMASVSGRLQTRLLRDG